MVSEKLKEWVKNKREKGVSDERIRKSLERTGHDPEVLDEIDNPFQEDNIEPEDPENNSDISEEDDFEFSDEDILDNKDIEKNEESEDEETNETKSKLKELEQDLDTSSLRFSRKKVGAGIFLILLIAGGIAAYSFMPDNLNLLQSVDEETAPEPGSLEQLDAQYAGCPDSAVRVQSVSSSDGSTTANVKVSIEEAHVVLKVMRDGELLGFTTDTFIGESQMTVGEVGNQVKLRPLGCKDRFSLRDY